MIYTSRYGNEVGIMKSGALPVAISIGRPKWAIAYEIAGSCHQLRPTPSLFALREGDREIARKAWRRHLESYSIGEIVRSLGALAEKAGAPDADIVLLCFEDLRIEGVWCHREFVREWLVAGGIPCEELDTPPLEEKAAARELQLLLF